MLFVAKQNITALLQIKDFLNTVHVISILIENMCINTKKKKQWSQHATHHAKISEKCKC